MTSEFSRFHPIVIFLYFALAIGISMLSMSIYFLGITFILSWIYTIFLGGKQAIKFNIIVCTWTLIIMAIVNTLFTHNGETVLFYINTNRITLEAFTYGIAAAVLLISIILWFSCFNRLMTSDKLIYLFGKVTPTLGLTLSMIFRFIPLLKSRFKEISTGQRCMGITNGSGNMSKIRQLVKEVSILIAWSLEASIESADSMESRGYGLKGRTSFYLYVFTIRDTLMLIIELVLGGMCIFGVIKGNTTMIFYPTVQIPSMDLLSVITLISFIILLSLPIIIDIMGELKWKQYA